MTPGKGKKSTQSVQAQELANAKKKQLENSGPYRPRVVVKIHILESLRFQFKDKGICRGPLAVGSAFHGRGRKTEKELPHPPPSPTHPFDSRAQWPAAAFSLAGEGCGEGNFSAEDELLRADCR